MRDNTFSNMNVLITDISVNASKIQDKYIWKIQEVNKAIRWLIEPTNILQMYTG